MSVNKQTSRVMKTRQNDELIPCRKCIVVWSNVDLIIIIQQTSEWDKISRKRLSPSEHNKRTKAENMLEAITSTMNSVSSFANITTTLATTASVVVFDYTATEFLNANISSADDTNQTELFHPCDGDNPVFNCTVDEYLSYSMGAKRMPLETAIWVSWLKEIRRIFTVGDYGGVSMIVDVK